VKPDLDHWLPNPALEISHQRESSANAKQLWAAASELQLRDAGLLGRLIRWRIPGIKRGVSFDELFTSPPFIALESKPNAALVSGIVGRIWTLRRDYPELAEPDEFRSWATRGTAKVLFANWVEPRHGGGSALVSTSRVKAIGRQGKMGLTAVRPLIMTFHGLVGSDGIEAAVRRAESG
jgi:hypothetical protein